MLVSPPPSFLLAPRSLPFSIFISFFGEREREREREQSPMRKILCKGGRWAGRTGADKSHSSKPWLVHACPPPRQTADEREPERTYGDSSTTRVARLVVLRPARTKTEEKKTGGGRKRERERECLWAGEGKERCIMDAWIHFPLYKERRAHARTAHAHTPQPSSSSFTYLLSRIRIPPQSGCWDTPPPKLDGEDKHKTRRK